jgi:hypothetical protein
VCTLSQTRTRDRRFYLKEMPVAIVAVGAFALVKMGTLMGQYSLQNYDPNPTSAYDRKQTLPGTDGKPVDPAGKLKKKRLDDDGRPSKD